MKLRINFLIIIGILLLGCSPSVQSKTPLPDRSRIEKAPSQQLPLNPPLPQRQTALGQNLPISANALIAGRKIQLEVAKTSSEQATGLMYRTSLADDRGMLFPFNPPRPVSFWMKNVKINLDMVFLRKGIVQAIAANVPPCTSDPCPSYGPETPIDQVLELRGGLANELGIKPGDRVIIQNLSGNKKP